MIEILRTDFDVKFGVSRQYGRSENGAALQRFALEFDDDWAEWKAANVYCFLNEIAGIEYPTDEELIKALSNRETAYMWVRKWGGRPIDLWVNRTTSFKNAYLHYLNRLKV